MDLEELITNERENPKHYSQADGTKQKKKNKEVALEYKERKSIS